jgi:predicted small secreted protein
MTKVTKHLILLLFVITLFAATGSGCQTANGFGKDMEKAGEKIQKETK